METVAACDECGADIGFPWLIDINLKASDDAYRLKHGIIPPERIKEIPEMYGISIRAFAKLISMDEDLYLQYCERGVPTKDTANLFQRLYSNPSFYLEVLEKNKQHIGMKAFAKSKETVLKMLEGTEFYPESCGNFREIVQEIEADDAETPKPQNGENVL
jgi:hypothetical protein